MNLDNLYIKQIIVGPMMNFAYLVGDKSTKEAGLVDPGWDGKHLIEEAAKEGFEIRHVLATHTHFDHVNEVHYLSNKLNLTVHVNTEEAGAFNNIARVKEFTDGDVIKIGKLDFKVLQTPGHTKGSSCFIIDNALFTGDTLFIDGIGRTDLEGGDSEEMYHSLERLRELPDGMIVYPGHHYGPVQTATMGEQKKTNPYLRCTSVSDFLRIA